MPPIVRQRFKRRAAGGQRFRHFVSQQPTQRRQEGGERLEIDGAAPVLRQDRFPREEIAEQIREGRGVLFRHGACTVFDDVAGQLDDASAAFAAAIQRPFVSVGVEDVRNGRKALELIAIAAAETALVRTAAGRLELHIARQRAVARNGEIRPAEAIRQHRFAAANNFEADLSPVRRQQALEWRAQLIFGAACRQRRLSRNFSGEVPQRGKQVVWLGHGLVR